MAKRVIVCEGVGEELNPLEINKTLGNTDGKPKRVKKLSAEIDVREMLKDVAAIQSAPKVTILIHSGSGKTGGEPVFVAVNGIGYLIPRDKQVSIPEPILKGLENACETQYYREEKDGQTFGPVVARNVPRFAINKLR